MGVLVEGLDLETPSTVFAVPILHVAPGAGVAIEADCLHGPAIPWTGGQGCAAGGAAVRSPRNQHHGQGGCARGGAADLARLSGNVSFLARGMGTHKSLFAARPCHLPAFGPVSNRGCGAAPAERSGTKPRISYGSGSIRIPWSCRPARDPPHCSSM